MSSGEELSMIQTPSRLNSSSSFCNPTSLHWVKKCRFVCVGMTRRRLIAAGTMRQWRPRLEEANREARQLGVGVRGGKVALRARVHHEAKNWLILTDCSNVFNTVKRTAMLAEAATCVPALTPFVAKCYGEMSAPVFFQMELGERRKIDCSSGVQHGGAMGPALFCIRSCRC